MKKILAVLLVFFVVLLALLGALSVLPHAHGSDLDHSTHKSCPVYQFSLHDSGAVLVVFCFVVTAFFVGYLIPAQEPFFLQPSRRFASPRAPPPLF